MSLIVLFIINTLYLHGIYASGYIKICALRDSPRVSLSYDFETGDFFIGGKSNIFIDSTRTTDLSHNSSLVYNGGDHRRTANEKLWRHLDEPRTKSLLTYEAIICPCAPQYFCMAGDGDVCGVPRLEDEPVSCFHISNRTTFIRNAWPVVVLWYGALFIFLLGTENGKYARNYVLSKFCKSRNERTADQIISNEHEIRVRVRAAAYADQHRFFRSESGVTSDELVLKIKLFDSSPKSDSTRQSTGTPDTDPVGSSSDDLSEDDAVTCTICIGEIEQGDRIGALPCDHAFHVDCLKQWLKRRNVCPLCLVPDIASPRRRELSEEQEEQESQMQTVGVTSVHNWRLRQRRHLTLNPVLPIVQGSPIPPLAPRNILLRGRRTRIPMGSVINDGNYHENPHDRLRRQLFPFHENDHTNNQIPNPNEDTSNYQAREANDDTSSTQTQVATDDTRNIQAQDANDRL